MRKRSLRAVAVSFSEKSAVCFILVIAFFAGSIAGCALVNRVAGEGEIALSEYFEGYFDQLSSGTIETPGLWTLLWENFRWPLFVVLLGVTPLGLLGIPSLFVVRGFLLSFSSASLFRLFGFPGTSLAFVLFGITGVLCLPVLFFYGIQGFLTSGAIIGRLIGEGRKRPVIDRSILLRYGVCTFALCVSCFMEYYLVPRLLNQLSVLLLG